MATINLGSQIVSFYYQEPAVGIQFNRLNYKLINRGIHSGGQISIVDNTHINIAPFLLFFEDTQTGVGVRIEATTQVANFAVNSSSPYVYGRFLWNIAGPAYLQFGIDILSNLQADDIIFGKLIFNGSTLVSVDYSRTSYAQDYWLQTTGRDPFFRVIPTDPIYDSHLTVLPGPSVVIDGKLVTVSANLQSPSFTLPASSSGRSDILVLNSSGQLAIIQGSGAVGVLPNIDSKVLPLAIVNFPANATVVQGDYIQYIHPNFFTSGQLVDTSSPSLQIGGGPILNNNSNVLEIKDPTNVNFEVIRFANPVANNDGVNLGYLTSWGGDSSISTVGTITTGTWHGTTLETGYGGTGLSSIGTANQILGVNSVATALEYKSLVAGTNISLSNSTGSITIDNTYTLPQATSTILGGVTIGSNITVSSGQISLSSSNVTSALGYTPVNSAIVGQPSGLATLDGTGKLTTSQIPSSLVGALVYQGTWNASTNTPTITSSVGTKGNYYVVSTAGTTTIDGVSTWEIGDWIVFDGTKWDRLQGNASDVISFNGRTGAITFLSSDLPLASTTVIGGVKVDGSTIISTSGLIAVSTSNLTVGTGLSITGGTGALVGTSGASISLSTSVVTSVVNDTNVTGSIASNALTIGWTGTLAYSRGGTGYGTYSVGDILYGNSTNGLSTLAGNTTTTKMFLSQTGTGTVSASPSWAQIVSGDINNTSFVTSVSGATNRISVGGTALAPTIDISSAYVGQTSITTLGTITSGTWNGTSIGTGYGGTGLSSLGIANQILGMNNGASALEYKSLNAGSNITITNTAGAISIANTYSYTLPTASTTVLGGVKVDGTSITIASDIISATPYSLPTASTTVLGGVKVDGTSITISSDIISATPYTLPTATTTVLGGVKPDGTTITITSGGVISAVGGGGGSYLPLAGGTMTGAITLASVNDALSGTNPATGSFNEIIHTINNSSGYGIFSYNTSSGYGFYSNNTSTGYGIFSYNTSSGYGIFSYNTSSGTGFYSNNTSTGTGFYSNNTSTGTGFYSYNSSTGNGIASDNSSTGNGIASGNYSTGTGFYSGNYSTGVGILAVSTLASTGGPSIQTYAPSGVHALDVVGTAYFSSTYTGTGPYTLTNPLTISTDSSGNGIIDSASGTTLKLNSVSSNAVSVSGSFSAGATTVSSLDAGSGSITTTGTAYATEFIASSSLIASNTGSDTVSSGAYVELGAATGGRQLLQLSSAGNLDLWMYNGSAWSKNATFSNVGDLTLQGYIYSAKSSFPLILEHNGSTLNTIIWEVSSNLSALGFRTSGAVGSTAGIVNVLEWASSGAVTIPGTLSAGATMVTTLGISSGSLGMQADGSDTVGAGNHIQVNNVASTQAYIQQLSASGNIDWWTYNANWTKQMTLGNGGGLTVNGTLSATSKSFNIVHPLDPAKRLVHGSLEGPEFGVYYRGESQLEQGLASITLPDYFEALTALDNRTILITPIFEGVEAISNLAVSAVVNGVFSVKALDSNNPSQKFYWEVKAYRKDVPPLTIEY